MKLYEFINETSQFGIAFSGDLSGGGWVDDLEQIIKSKINPTVFERNEKEVNWSYCDIDFNLRKDDVQFILKIDKADTISLILINNDSNTNKQKLREWATIIAEEAEKLNK